MREVARATGARGFSTLELTLAMPLVVFAMLLLIGLGHALISKQHAVVGGQFAAHYQRVRESAPNAATIGQAVSGGAETFKLSGGGGETLSFTASATPRKGLIAQIYRLKATASQYQTPNVTNACVPRCRIPIFCVPLCKPQLGKILSPEMITGVIVNGIRGSLSPENILSTVAGMGNKKRRQKPDGAVAVVPPKKRSGNGSPEDGSPQPAAGGAGGGNQPPGKPPARTGGVGDDGKPGSGNSNGKPVDGKNRSNPTPGAAKRPIDKLDDWEKSGKIRGAQKDLDQLKERLNSPDSNTRRAAEAEVEELEAEIAAGRTPEVRGARKGPDQSDYEVKARTEPFTSRKNAQNFLNDRIKVANDQFKGQNGRGRVVINLGENTKIGDSTITREMARDMVKEALSKGNRGTNITKVVVKDGKGNIIYEGLGE